MGRNTVIGALVLLLSWLNLTGICMANDEGPLAQLQGTVEKVIGILQDEKLLGEDNKEIRRTLVVQEVCNRFNFQLMAKLSLGDVWERISEKQQDEFSGLFSNLLKTTYIQRVEAYSDEKVLYGKEIIKKNLAQVSSIFEKNNTQLSVVYRLSKEKNGQWLVYDVVIEGASLVKQYRRQFAQVIEQEDFSGLILRLQNKVKAIGCKT